MTQQISETTKQQAGRSGIEEVKLDTAAPLAPVRHVGRQGFLPIKTNTFDRVFISVVSFVAIHLLWMRFVEAFVPLWVATILSLVLAILIILRG
jgi:predicted small integral membrane protein